MMNILFVQSVSVIGGAEKVSLEIMIGLSDQFECHSVCSGEGELHQESAKFCGQASTLVLPQLSSSKISKVLLSNIVLLRYILKNNIDIIHVSDHLAYKRIKWLGLIPKVKVVSHFHFPIDRGFFNWVYSGLVHPDSFIFCSSELNEAMAGHIKSYCPDTICRVIHNGIDLDRMTASGTHSDGGRFKVGIVANLQKRKGHEDFLSMAKILHDEGLDFEYHIVGGDILDKPRLPVLKELAKEAGVEQSVVFHGQVRDVLPIVEQMDVVVCASHEEAFPISILEAMAMAKCIVATNVNGIPEAIVDGDCGLLVSAKSPSGLAEKVKFYYHNPTIRLQHGTSARQRVENNFGRKLFLKKVQDLYSELGHKGGV